MEFSPSGKHVIADAWGLNSELIDDAELLQNSMVEVAEACGLTILSVQCYKFSPQGATIIVLLAESHFSIHTYPEKGFAAIDCYTCGEATDPNQVVNKLLTILKPKNIYVKKLLRGVGDFKIFEP